MISKNILRILRDSDIMEKDFASVCYFWIGLLFTGNGFKNAHPNLVASVHKLCFTGNKDILLIEEYFSYLNLWP